MSDPRCCCVSGPCILLEDPLTDSASSDLSSDWVEVSGDWEYTGTYLQENGTDDAVAATVARASHTDMHVHVKAKDSGTPRVILCYRDEDNYLFAEVEMTGGPIRLGSVSGGVTSETEFPIRNPINIPLEDVSIQVCYSHDGLLYMRLADVADELLQWEFITVIGPGKRAGLGNGSTGTVQYWEFGFYDHIYHADPPNAQFCPQCMCVCGGNNPPTTLTATWWDAGGCPELDGASMAYEIEHADGVGPLEYALSTFPFTCDACDWYGALNCTWDGITQGDGPCVDWNISSSGNNPLHGSATCWESTITTNANPTACTCNPYYFYFSGLDIRWDADDQTCCTLEEAFVDLEFEE